ncbi:MAG: hypothetical protein WHU10_06785 [Fimbriimonadales bacterium]
MREIEASELTDLQQIRRAPSLTTINGIGFRLFGFQRIRGTSLSLATHWLVVFFLPVLPIARYVVEPAGLDTWRFHYKVRPAKWQYRWQLAMVILLISLMVVPPCVDWLQSRSAISAEAAAPPPSSGSQPSRSVASATPAVAAVPPPPSVVEEPKPKVGPRSKTGHRIGRWRGANGPNLFRLVNDTEKDAAVALVPVGKNRAYRYFYVRAGESFQLRKVRSGTFRVVYQLGSDWSEEAKRFLTDLEAFRSEDTYRFRTWEEGPDADGWIRSYSTDLTLTIYTTVGFPDGLDAERIDANELPLPD